MSAHASAETHEQRQDVGRKTSHGFTLLEVIIALVLMTALLAVLWTMINSFRDRFEKSQQRVAQSQIIAAVQRVVTDDLRSVQYAHRQTPRSDQSTRRRTTLRAVAGNDDRSVEVAIDSLLERDGETSSVSKAMGFDGARESPVDRPSLVSAHDESVSQREWMFNGLRFYGTSTSLVIDIMSPAEIPASTPASPNDASEPDIERGVAVSPAPVAQEGIEQRSRAGGGIANVETAMIPDHRRRVVYMFHDPATGMRVDRPAGLLRCEMSMTDMVQVRTKVGDNTDLIPLLRSLITEQPVDPLLGEQIHALATWETAEAAATENAAEQPIDTEAQRAQWELSQSLAWTFHPHLDYIPEVAALRFRYYDGSSWRDTWNSDQTHSLPVAVELRMRLVEEVYRDLPPRGERGSDRAPMSEESVANVETAMRRDPQAPLGDETENDVSSLRMAPLEDHRYLVFLSTAVSENGPAENAATSLSPMRELGTIRPASEATQ